MKSDTLIASVCYVLTTCAIVAVMQQLPNVLEGVRLVGINAFAGLLPSLAVCIASAIVHIYVDVHIIRRQALEARVADEKI